MILVPLLHFRTGCQYPQPDIYRYAQDHVEFKYDQRALLGKMKADVEEMGPILPHTDMITVKDKILIHLMDYSAERYMGHDWESLDQIIESMPIDVTQEGIAKAVGIKWTHVSRALKEFETFDVMIARKANIAGVEKRRNVYFLNYKGLELGKSRLDQIIGMDFDAIYKEERIQGSLKDIISKVGEEILVLDLIRDVNVPSTDQINIDTLMEDVRRRAEDEALPYVVHVEGLPAPRHFFGREDDLGSIDELLKSDCRVVVVQGIAGIGKSSLANKLIEKYSSEMSIYYYQFHEWDTYRAVLTPLTEFLHKLGKDNLRRYMRSKKRLSSMEEEHIAIDLYDIFELVSKDFQDLEGLLIFDDLQKAEEKMGGLLSLFLEVFERHGGPNIVVLTRNIPAFYTQKDIISGRVKEQRLMGLDLESTRKLLDAKGLEVPDVERIYEATGGHPLSIELMRDPFDLIKPSELRRFIQSEILSKLEPEQREFLTKLAIFRRPVLPEAFILATPEYDILEELINHILVQEITYSGYKVQELIREFLISTIPRDELFGLHLNAANYFLAAEGEEPILEAIYHFKSGGEMGRAADIAVENGRQLILRGYLEDLKNTLNIETTDVPKRLRADFLLLIADIAMGLNNWDTAEEKNQEAIKWAGDENKQVLGSALKNLGKIDYERANWEDALEHFQKSVEISEEIGDSVILGDVYRSIGQVHWRNGESEKATEHFEKALEYAKEATDIQLESEIYVDMANNIRITEMEKAIDLYQTAIKTFTEMGMSYALGRVYNNLGTVHYNAELFDEALEYWKKAITVAENSGYPKLKAWALFNSSDILTRSGDFSKAWSVLEESKEILQQIGDRVGLAYIGIESAVVLSNEKKWEDAEETYTATIREITEMNIPVLLAEAHYQYGQMNLARGKPGDCVPLIEKAVEIYRSLGKIPLADKLEGEAQEIKERAGLT